MSALIPAHFTVACLFAIFLLDNGETSHTSITYFSNDTSRITDEYFNTHDTLVYDPVCARGRTFLNDEVARLAGATDPKKGCCSSYGTVTVTEPNRFWIAGVELNGMSNHSGASGYSNHVNVVFEVFKNDSNILSLYRKPTGMGVQQWKVWIDFDGDQRFETEELVVDAVAQDIAVPFYLPENAELGSFTRMRIFTGQRGSDLTSNTLLVGEVEDYTVEVVQ